MEDNGKFHYKGDTFPYVYTHYIPLDNVTPENLRINKYLSLNQLGSLIALILYSSASVVFIAVRGSSS